MTASNVSRTTPIGLRVEAAVQRPSGHDVTLVGTVGPLTPAPVPVDATLSFDLLPASDEVEAQLRATPAARGAGLPMLDGTVTLHDVKGHGANAAYGLAQATIRLAGHAATLEPTRVAAGGAAVDLSATIDSLVPPVRFDVRARTDDAPLRELAHSTTLEGRLTATLHLIGAGATKDAIVAGLRGDGQVAVVDGVLHGVNLAEAVLRAATGVPGLAGLIPASIPARYPEVFATQDTRFERAGGTFTIAERRVRTDELALAARDYAMHVVATLVASERLTNDVVQGVREARFLTDADGRLAIPFHLTGTWPQMRPVPDAATLTTALRRNLLERGREMLGGETSGTRGGKETLRRGVEGLLGR